MEHADAGLGPDAEPDEPEPRSYASMHGCLVLVALAVFIVVFVPLLIWAAAIIFTGAR
jgi:hypothetical protein